MNEDYRLLTPENVELHYDVAGLGSRLLAATVDYAIIGCAYLALSLGSAFIAAFIGRAFPGAVERGSELSDFLGFAVIAAIVLVTFVAWWGYFIVFELLWNGQSPGKRMVGLRVARADGQPLGLGSSLIRNVLRAIDILALIGVVVMVVDGKGRRLGDFAAGTLVVHEPRALQRGTYTAVLIPPAPPGRVEALPNAGRLTMAHYTLLRDYFGRRDRLDGKRADALAAELASDLATLLEVERQNVGDPGTFLAVVAHAFEARHTYHDVGVG
jgi:uncharacterized RDD family membrane protein YckC